METHYYRSLKELYAGQILCGDLPPNDKVVAWYERVTCLKCRRIRAQGNLPPEGNRKGAETTMAEEMTMAEEETMIADRPKTEAIFQASILAMAKAQSWMGYHTHDSRRSEKGFPDLVLVHVTHGILFAEVKLPGRKATTEQESWLTQLSAAGGRTYLWYPDHWQGICKVLHGERVGNMDTGAWPPMEQAGSVAPAWPTRWPEGRTYDHVAEEII